MKYELDIKPVSDEDTTSECPYVPENKELEENLSILLDCIQEQNEVNSLEYNRNIISLETDLEQRDLMDQVKPCFAEAFCYWRYVRNNNNEPVSIID